MILYNPGNFFSLYDVILPVYRIQMLQYCLCSDFTVFPTYRINTIGLQYTLVYTYYHRESTAREEKGWERCFFHQIEPN